MEGLEQTVIEVDARSRSNTKRLDKLEADTSTLHELVTAVKVMASKMDVMSVQVDKLDGKVEALEAKPGKRYEGLVEKLIWAVVGAAAAYILPFLGL